MNSDKHLLSIAIPTFERGEAVIACVTSLLEQPSGSTIPIRVYDNASSDGSWETIQKLNQYSNVVLSRNDKNLGFQGNFITALRSSPTEYCILLSDEDLLDLEVLPVLMESLEANPPLSFLSPCMEIDGSVYRGRNTMTPIAPANFLGAAFYLSGLIYRVPDALQAIDKTGLEHFVHQDQVYPQCLLVAALLADGKHAYWHQAIFSSKSLNLPTRINDESMDAPYTSLEKRAKQVKLFANVFTEMIGKATTDEETKRWTELRNRWMRYAFTHLRNGFAWEFPADIKAFDKSGAAYFDRGLLTRSKSVLRTLKRWIRTGWRKAG